MGVMPYAMYIEAPAKWSASPLLSPASTNANLLKIVHRVIVFLLVQVFFSPLQCGLSGLVARCMNCILHRKLKAAGANEREEAAAAEHEATTALGVFYYSCE